MTDDTPNDAGAGFARMLAAWRVDGAPILMGIVNVTPDSFSDGGLHAEAGAALAHGEALLEAGAAMLDIGGESTRGGAAAVSVAEELSRVLPAIAGLRRSSTLLSIDTMKAAVADAALRAGAHVVNDVRGLQGDPDMAAVVARRRAGVIAMHNPGLLGSSAPTAGDVVRACLAFFERSLHIARAAGVAEDRIALDPGIGFGKSVDQNIELIARLPELAALGFPILIGASRKSFIGKLTGRDLGDRLMGTVAVNVAAALAGAAILRVHDVADHVDAMRIAAAVRRATPARPAA